MALQKNVFLLAGIIFLIHTLGVWADVVVNMEDRVEVMRGDTAQITCMFTIDEGIGGMVIKWFYRTPTNRKLIYSQDTTMKIVEKGTGFTDRISVTGPGNTGELVLTIRDVQLQDELDFICHISGLTEGNGEGHTQLRVFEKPEPPTIEAIDTGFSNNEKIKIGTCEAKNGFPRPNITWFRNNTPLMNDRVDVRSVTTQESNGLFSVKSELSMKLIKEDEDAYFYCEVSYYLPGETRMVETNKINITIHYSTTAITMWVESPKGDIKEGDTVEIHCRGNGNPQPTFTFKKGDDDLLQESSVLVLRDVTRVNSGLYHCSILDIDTFNEITGNASVFVNYLEPALVMPENPLLAQGDNLQATCNALSSLHTDTAWFKNGKEVAKGHTLKLMDATYDMAGTYTCVVTVPRMKDMESNATLEVVVKGPPEISKPVHTAIESVEKMVSLSCHARGYPAPTVMWSSSDAQIPKTVSHQISKDNTLTVHSVVSFQVTSDFTAFCNASNELGTDAVSFSIKAIQHTTVPHTTILSTATTPVNATPPAPPPAPPKKTKKEGSGVIIAVLIICILLLAILGSVLYFLYKKGKICNRSGKQDFTKEKSNKDIVVEMKSDSTEDAVLLGVNGEKKPPNDQGDAYLNMQR